jgi:hypothetical protein
VAGVAEAVLPPAAKVVQVVEAAAHPAVMDIILLPPPAAQAEALPVAVPEVRQTAKMVAQIKAGTAVRPGGTGAAVRWEPTAGALAALQRVAVVVAAAVAGTAAAVVATTPPDMRPLAAAAGAT